MKHLGKWFEYKTHDDTIRKAKCVRIEFNNIIGKWVFTGISTFGHEVRLTKDEILQFNK